MFIGHFAVGFGMKRLAPNTSFTLLLTAPLLLDLLWPIFLVTGIERAGLNPGAPTRYLTLDLQYYPWSHSLLMAVAWSLAFAALARTRRGAICLGIGVFSHWVLDFVTHRPDIALWPGGAARVGLGLWYSTAGTAITESLMYVAGVALFLRSTRARTVWGHVSAWSLILFLSVGYVMTLVGPPPPSFEAVRYASLATWLIVPWAYWIERTRS